MKKKKTVKKEKEKESNPPAPTPEQLEQIKGDREQVIKEDKPVNK